MLPLRQGGGRARALGGQRYPASRARGVQLLRREGTGIQLRGVRHATQPLSSGVRGELDGWGQDW